MLENSKHLIWWLCSLLLLCVFAKTLLHLKFQVGPYQTLSSTLVSGMNVQRL